MKIAVDIKRNTIKVLTTFNRLRRYSKNYLLSKRKNNSKNFINNMPVKRNKTSLTAMQRSSPSSKISQNTTLASSPPIASSTISSIKFRASTRIQILPHFSREPRF